MHIRDFSSLAFGAITPTDIDAFMDFGGKVFVIIEAKCGNAKCKPGQQLALERLCDACQAGGVETILILASHPKTDEDIEYSTLPVSGMRYKGKWLPGEEWTVRKLIVDFRNRVTREQIKESNANKQKQRG